MRMIRLVLAAVLLASCADTVIPQQPRRTDPVIGLAPRATLGTVLTADGMTVYVYTMDSPGKTVCYDVCAMEWPALLVTHTPSLGASFPGRFASVTRADGAKQLTYNDLPLYLYNEDLPGTDQANGQNVDHDWFVVHP